MSWNQAPPVRQTRTHSRWAGVVSVVALVLAVTAVGVSVWTALRPAPSTSADATFSAEQQAAAKAATCGAADLVRKGVTINTNLQSPGGASDVTGSLTVAANARLALSQGGQYLIARVTPATPTDLAESAEKFANTLLDIGAAATAGALNTDPDQVARLQAADTENTNLANLCAA